MDNNRIEELLEKYWRCETTLPEEEEIHSFFVTKEIPPHLEKYKVIFQIRQEEESAGLDNTFDERILQLLEKEEKKKPHFKTRKTFWQIAASIAALFILFFAVDRYVYYNDPWQQETYETPEEALAEIQKVFSTVSGHLEKGQEMISRNMEKVEPMTTIIK